MNPSCFNPTAHLKMLKVLFLGLVVDTCVSAGADVVLSCSLVGEGGGLDATGSGAFFTHTPATLVLRDVPVTTDESLETLGPFIPPTVPDPDLILFEAKVSSIEIPHADVLLHADCNDQEIACEIGSYFPNGSQNGEELAFFIGSLRLEGGGLSITVILQTLDVESDKPDEPPLIQSKLKLPLSKSGSLLTEVVFVVFSTAWSVSAPLRGDVLLNCGFRQQKMSPVDEIGLEWRQQHKGSGRTIVEMRARLNETEESPQVHAHREGSSVDATLLVGEGNASLTMTKLQVSDEGTYICTVNAGLLQAQQIIQLNAIKKPSVSLSEEKIVFTDESPQRLSCHAKNYYPLDVQMEWLSLSPADAEPAVLPDQGSLSSHRQHSDGTFTLSSHLTLRPFSFPPGTTVICMVSHTTLDTPLLLSLTVEEPEPVPADSYMMFLGFLVITVLFFYQVMR